MYEISLALKQLYKISLLVWGGIKLCMLDWETYTISHAEL